MAQKDRRARTRDPTRGARRGAAAMPYVLTATHTGWSKAFGAPTGRKVKYHGIANCYIKKEPSSGQWQYTREW